MLPPLAALGCFGYTAALALRATGAERAMFSLVAGLSALVFFAVVVS